MKQVRIAVALFLVLAVSWIVPPAVLKLRHLCPVRSEGVREAAAVPAFARKYGLSCQQCHAGFPVLNSYGRQFRLQGYVRNPGGDEGVLQSEDKQLWTEKLFPWGLVVRSRPFDNGRGTISNAGTQMGATANPNPNGFKWQPVNDVDFFVAGGDVARKVSWFGEFDANTPSGLSVGLSDLKLGYHPSQYFHIVLMRRGFFVDDPYQTISGAETPTIANRATDLGLSDQGSISGNMITNTQQTAYFYGQLFLPQNKDSFSSPSFIYYAAGASKDSDLGQQKNAPTNGYARLAFDNGSGLMLGTFGSYGHEGPRDDSAYTGAPTPPFTNANGGQTWLAASPADMIFRQQFVKGGFDALWEFNDLAARGAFLYQHDGDPTLRGATATDRAAYAELAYYYKRGDALYPFLVPLVRYNWYTTFNGKEQFDYVTAQLQHFFAPNWKVLAEYSVDTKTAYQGGNLANPELSVAMGGAAIKALRGNRFTIQTAVGF